jgi:adenylate kinase family enzyme
MQRLLIIGCPGAGKSTLCRQLAGLLRLEAIHLDSLYWTPGWVEASHNQWMQDVAQALQRESWIIDGNYLKTLPPRLAAADTVIFLDLPRRTCLLRIVRRWLRYRGTTRPDMPADCPERLDWEFVKWVWDFHADQRPAILEHLRQVSPAKRVIMLRSPNEVDLFVRGMALTGRSPA